MFLVCAGCYCLYFQQDAGDHLTACGSVQGVPAAAEGLYQGMHSLTPVSYQFSLNACPDHCKVKYWVKRNDQLWLFIGAGQCFLEEMIHSWPLLQGISDAVCPVRCSCLLSQPTPFCFFSCEMCGKVKRNLAESAPGGATPLSCCLFLYFLFPSPRTFISFYLVVITEARYPTYAHVLTKE